MNEIQEQNKEVLEKMLKANMELLTPEFLAKVNPQQVDEVITQAKNRIDLLEAILATFDED